MSSDARFPTSFTSEIANFNSEATQSTMLTLGKLKVASPRVLDLLGNFPGKDSCDKLVLSNCAKISNNLNEREEQLRPL